MRGTGAVNSKANEATVAKALHRCTRSPSDNARLATLYAGGGYDAMGVPSMSLLQGRATPAELEAAAPCSTDQVRKILSYNCFGLGCEDGSTPKTPAMVSADRPPLPSLPLFFFGAGRSAFLSRTVCAWLHPPR